MREAQALPWLDRSREHGPVLDPRGELFRRPAVEASEAEGVCACTCFLAVAPPGDGPHFGEICQHPWPAFGCDSVRGQRRARNRCQDQRGDKEQASASHDPDTAFYWQEVHCFENCRRIARRAPAIPGGAVTVRAVSDVIPVMPIWQGTTPDGYSCASSGTAATNGW